MIRTAFLVLIVSILAASSVSLAQSTAPTQAPGSDAIPAKIKLVTRDFKVNADGSTINTVHSEVQVLTMNGVSAFAQSPIDYVDSTQEVDVKDAYTLKPDGRKVPVASDAIITQQKPRANATAPLTDLKQKVIVFPDVGVGDTVVFTAIIRSKPEIPGTFMFDTLFPPTIVVDESQTTVTAPQTFPLNVESRDISVETAKSGGNVSYTVHFANANPVSDTDQAVSRFDRSPRLSLSSAKSYDDLAKSYAALIRPETLVTPAIRARADEITAGVTDHREQAKRLYDWVSQHVRYVAIEFGQGSIVPHKAESVLTNGYGDCKDHAVLFGALLQAKGIASNLVLVNAVDGYTVAKVPTFGAFNHVITWIPELGIYADTTSGMTPFGVLPRSEYGKPVARIGDPAGALQQTPVLAADQSTITDTTVVKFDDRARVSSTNTITATGAMSGVLRGIGVGMQSDNANKLAGLLLKDRGMPRAQGSYTASAINELTDSYSVKGDYTTPGSWVGVLQGKPVLPPNGLQLFVPTGSLLWGPIADAKFKNADAVPCYSGHDVEDYSLEFPDVFRLENLPKDSDIKTAHFDYSAHWSANGQTIQVHREITAHFDEQVCTGDTRKDAAAALAQIGREYQARFTLSLMQSGAKTDSDSGSKIITVPGNPFDVAVSADQHWIFVSVDKRSPGQAGSVAVLENRDGEIKIHHVEPMANMPFGMVLTHDGKLLIVAVQDAHQDGYAVLFDTDRLISGVGDPRHVIAPRVAYTSEGPHSGSVRANVTADDKTLFVSNESANTISVFDLESIRTNGLSAGSSLGNIPVGAAPVALTFSPDGKWLYTTSEIAPEKLGWPRTVKSEDGGPGMNPEGALIVIDVAKAKVDPANSIVRYVPAGGSPVRLALSPDGSRLFVTARGSDAVLVFDTAKLMTDSEHAKLATIPVGKSPVPVSVAENGRIVVVGNSRRFESDANHPSTLSVLDTAKIETGGNAVIGTIPAGAFPRDSAVSPDGETLYVTNYSSNSLQVIDLNMANPFRQ